MDENQREIMESKMMNMIHYWNDIEKLKANEKLLEAIRTVRKNPKRPRTKKATNQSKMLNPNNTIIKEKCKTRMSKPRPTAKSKKRKLVIQATQSSSGFNLSS